jgi:uncharacterized membrane protein YdjX (TVP38/TMEM64 family)
VVGRIFKSTRAAVRFGLVVLLVFLVMLVLYLTFGLFTDVLRHPASMRHFLRGLGPWSPLVFILIQILQVIFAPIPGQVAGFVSGYVYGVPLGMLYTMIGTTLGSLLAFSLARWLGRPFVEKVVAKDALAKFDYVSREKGLFTLFILFLLPIFPDDAICYIAGTTRIPIWKLVLVAFFGRFPGFLILNLVGAGFNEAGGWISWILLGSMIVISIILFLVKDRMERSFTRIVEKVRSR